MEGVQVHDLQELENYVYQPKPKVVDETLHQSKENESALPNHTCRYSTTGSTAKLAPLLQMISRFFSRLEDIPSEHIPYDKYSKSEIVAARQVMPEAHESLKNTCLNFAIRQGYCDFVSRQIAETCTIRWDQLKLAITFNQGDVVRLFATLSKLSADLKHLGLEEAAYQGRTEIMDVYMCDTAVDVNGCTETSPLKSAAAAGQVDAMKKLIHAGADLEAQGKTSSL